MKAIWKILNIFRFCLRLVISIWWFWFALYFW